MIAIGLLAVALLARAAGAAPDALGPCGPLARAHDVVELPVARLPGMAGVTLDRLGLLGFHDGVAVPEPFQIDERRGDHLVLPEGPEGEKDDTPGVLHDDDLVVFMMCDAGERAEPPAVERALASRGLATWRELRLGDAGGSAWLYLVVAEQPPRSERRYVEYVPAGDLVSTASYRVGMVNALPTYFALAPRGVLGENLLDGLRLRVSATLRGNVHDFALNEGQGRHRLIAWTRGPIRVIRRSRHEARFGLGIHLTAAVADTYFYPTHVSVPGSIWLPISPGLFFRTITAFGGVDFAGLDGWRYHAPGTPPEGFLVDGRMDAAERVFDVSADWFALTNGETAIVIGTTMSDNLRRGIREKLVYLDDAEARLPPERVPGAGPLVGYRGLDVEKLTAGRYAFRLSIFVFDHYRPGDEQAAIDSSNRPVAVSVEPGG